MNIRKYIIRDRDLAITKYLQKRRKDGTQMTMKGTVSKLLLLVGVACLSYFIIDYYTHDANGELCGQGILASTVLFTGLISGVFAWLNSRKPSAWFAIPFAFFFGGMPSTLYVMANTMFPGFIITPLLATLFVTLLCYYLVHTGKLKLSQKYSFNRVFMRGMIYFMILCLPAFHYNSLSGWVSLAFALFITVVMTLSLLGKLEEIQENINVKAPKNSEWYLAADLFLVVVLSATLAFNARRAWK